MILPVQNSALFRERQHQALDIGKNLAAIDPNNAEWQRYISESERRLASLEAAAQKLVPQRLLEAAKAMLARLNEAELCDDALREQYGKAIVEFERMLPR